MGKRISSPGPKRPALSAWVRPASILSGALVAAGAAWAQSVPLTVCMVEDNAPLSYQVGGQMRGLDLRIAQAASTALGRTLKVVPFETGYEKESTLAHEVGALLAAGVCEAASGFPLLAGDFGPPTRASARTPDYPGAKRKRERPYIPLAPMAPSRAYQAVALGVVLPAGAAPLASLADLGERKLGVTSGTLAGGVAMAWRNGALRSRLVSLGQREDPLAELARPAGPGGARFDALLMPLTLFDGWRRLHPGSTLTAAAYRRPIGVHLGFVTLAGNTAVRAALDEVITQARSDGRLASWAAEEGVSWAAPGQPEVTRGPSLAELAND